MENMLIAPFPYFGGKSAVAAIVWQALGDVKHYIEPFFGSGAVLLARPNYDCTRHIETVNDKSAFISNVWRALQHAPDEVAKYCDFPVNHVDLVARRLFLAEHEQELRERLIADPEYYDARLAGYWIWASSCWIGSGLTETGQSPHTLGRRPQISRAGAGIHKLGMRYNTSRRVGQRPHISDGGKGVHKLGMNYCAPDEAASDYKDVREPYNLNIYRWFRKLAERLRYVRVVCGDWTRVCGGNWQDLLRPVGIFFDPPYSVRDRCSNLYSEDDKNVAQQVADWCIERGKKETYRIVLAGYYDEHERLLDHGWRVYRWKTQGGYANLGHGQGARNRFREALFVSPHCLRFSLFQD